MPIPDDDAFDRMARATRHVEHLNRTRELPGKRKRIIGASSPSTTITGQATEAYIAGTSSIQIDNITVNENGIDPRPSPVSASQTIEVTKLGGGALKDNDWVVAVQMEGGGFEAVVRPGGDGDGSAPERFVMTADKAADDETGEARLLLDDPDWLINVTNDAARLSLEVNNDANLATPAVGVFIKVDSTGEFWEAIAAGTGADKWELFSQLGSKIIIVDKAGNIVAYGPYIDAAGAGEESVEADPEADPPVEEVAGQGGFKGIGTKFADDYDETGFPGYYVQEIESLVPIIYCKLKLASGGLKPTFVSATGSGPQVRLPKQSIIAGDSSGDPDVESFEAGDTFGLIDNSEENEEWGLTLDRLTDDYDYAFRLQNTSSLFFEILIPPVPNPP